MKKCFIVSFALVVFSALSYARINVLEPWHPGQDTKIGTLDSFQYNAAVMFGEKLQEVPFHLTYNTSRKMEVGGRWGIKNADGHFGISDLLLGMKYSFIEESINKPGVIGEAAVSLPTADHKNGLGYGSVGLLLNWAIEKRIEHLTGNFGIGLSMYGENSDKLQPGSIFSYHVGVSYPYSKLTRLHMEFKGFNHGAPKVAGISGSTYQEMYLAPGFDYVLEKRRAVLSGALLFGMTPESHDLGFILSAGF